MSVRAEAAILISILIGFSVLIKFTIGSEDPVITCMHAAMESYKRHTNEDFVITCSDGSIIFQMYKNKELSDEPTTLAF